MVCQETNPGMMAWSAVASEYDPLKIGSIDGTDVVPHDAGIVRAMNSTYKPNKKVTGNPNKTVFVARLNPDTEEDTIRRAFSEYGDIVKVTLVRDIVTGMSKGYAFIEYTRERDAFAAADRAHGMSIDANVILVEMEHERKMANWKPRRKGGGLGGKKESGQLRFGCKDRPWRKPLNLNMNPNLSAPMEGMWKESERESRKPRGDERFEKRYKDFRPDRSNYGRRSSRSPMRSRERRSRSRERRSRSRDRHDRSKNRRSRSRGRRSRSRSEDRTSYRRGGSDRSYRDGRR